MRMTRLNSTQHKENKRKGLDLKNVSKMNEDVFSVFGDGAGERTSESGVIGLAD